MPRKAAGARLYLHPERQLFYIRDGAKFVSTGTRGRREAETALARYIAGRDRPTGGPATPDQMTIANALAIYAEKHAPTVRAPERIGYAIQALLPILGRPAGRKHQQQRLPTIRREPGQGCRNGAQGTGRSPGCHQLRVFRGLSDRNTKGPSTREVRAARDRWLTRDEVARLLWAAYRSPKGKHLARFILDARSTPAPGPDAVLGLALHAQNGSGWLGGYRHAASCTAVERR